MELVVILFWKLNVPAQKKTVENYLSKGQISQKCKGQMNLQMLAVKKKKGLFCVADPNFENNKQFKFISFIYLLILFVNIFCYLLILFVNILLNKMSRCKSLV